jgi:isopentenyl-diphosphate Delta-isomerase
MIQEEKVILVDERDNERGVMNKMEAHQKGELHRAISVFIFNSENKMLLQQRAKEKYHSPNLWTNACCSHPRPGELNEHAAQRRLFEEMGINTALAKKFDFIYRAKFENGLTEHEYDHVFIGKYDGDPKLNKAEAQDWKWISTTALQNDLEENPDAYTAWFKLIMKDHLREIMP